MTAAEKRAFRKRYLRTIGLKATDPLIPAALDRAHALRQFEIENYWKRSTYFWGFQAVAFTAIALLFKDGRISHPGLVAPVAILGIVTALTGFLTAKGSKFWQENWERHVDLLEDREEGRLTKTVLTVNGSSYSVSRLNERLLVLLTGGWSIVFISGMVVVIFPELMTLSSEWWTKFIQVSVPLLFLMVSTLALFRGTESDLPGDEYEAPDFDAPRPRRSKDKGKPTIIKR